MRCSVRSCIPSRWLPSPLRKISSWQGIYRSAILGNSTRSRNSCAGPAQAMVASEVGYNIGCESVVTVKRGSSRNCCERPVRRFASQLALVDACAVVQCFAVYLSVVSILLRRLGEIAEYAKTNRWALPNRPLLVSTVLSRMRESLVRPARRKAERLRRVASGSAFWGSSR